MKCIFVTGGVLSGLGKGVAAASIGHLLSDSYRVVPVKCDGYLNTDPGTMNPVEHGEVFVLEDGGEVDMDFGHYERFMRVQCKSSWSLTMGKVFMRIVEAERRGDFLGKTVQFIPHVTDEIKKWWRSIAADEHADVLIIEIGGTVGDIENEMYIEAARQLQLELPRGSVLFAHLTYVPMLANVHEQKSKPSQQSVSMLRARGINPDLVLARSEEALDDGIRAKIALFASVPTTQVISVPDVLDVYHLPKVLQSQGILEQINSVLSLAASHNSCPWEDRLANLAAPQAHVTIAIAGKYTRLEDSYASVTEALKHAAAATSCQVIVRWIDTKVIHSAADAAHALAGVDAVIVPGGFGDSGIDGKLRIIERSRVQGIPFLGICYGMQLAVVEFARSVCGLVGAHTTEVNPQTPHPVVDFLPEQASLTHKGGTMRLGGFDAHTAPGSRIEHLYGGTARERHRHRYEVNPAYHETLTRHGLALSGLSPDGTLAEFLELPSHPYFVATQAHPELRSSLEEPAPLFLGLVQAARERAQEHSPAVSAKARVSEELL